MNDLSSLLFQSTTLSALFNHFRM